MWDPVEDGLQWVKVTLNFKFNKNLPSKRCLIKFWHLLDLKMMKPKKQGN